MKCRGEKESPRAQARPTPAPAPTFSSPPRGGYPESRPPDPPSARGGAIREPVDSSRRRHLLGTGPPPRLLTGPPLLKWEGPMPSPGRLRPRLRPSTRRSPPPGDRSKFFPIRDGKRAPRAPAASLSTRPSCTSPVQRVRIRGTPTDTVAEGAKEVVGGYGNQSLPSRSNTAPRRRLRPHSWRICTGDPPPDLPPERRDWRTGRSERHLGIQELDRGHRYPDITHEGTSDPPLSVYTSGSRTAPPLHRIRIPGRGHTYGPGRQEAGGLFIFNYGDPRGITP